MYRPAVIAKRRALLKAAQQRCATRTDEINRMGLDRRARREALDRVADELAADQDRIWAEHPLPEEMDRLKPNAFSADTAHLDALELRLSHERERLRAARTPREKAFRAQQVAGCEREIAGERKFLSKRGIDLSVDDDIASMSDDELLAELEANPRASYYVWVLAPHSDAPLSSEGPYGPHPLRIAEQMARIGATEGVHDRAVSLGRDPEAHGFRIERRYQARSGKRVV
jgi:hypothetical protein